MRQGLRVVRQPAGNARFRTRAGNIATVEPVDPWWAAVREARWPPPGTPMRVGIQANGSEPRGDRINGLVFIGRDLHRAAIELAFPACRFAPSAA